MDSGPNSVRNQIIHISSNIVIATFDISLGYHRGPSVSSGVSVSQPLGALPQLVGQAFEVGPCDGLWDGGVGQEMGVGREVGAAIDGVVVTAREPSDDPVHVPPAVLVRGEVAVAVDVAASLVFRGREGAEEDVQRDVDV